MTLNGGLLFTADLSTYVRTVRPTAIKFSKLNQVVSVSDIRASDDRTELRRLLQDSVLSCPANANRDVDQLFNTYEIVLRSVADQLVTRRRSTLETSRSVV